MDQQNDPFAFLSDLNNQDNFNTFLDQFKAPAVEIKKADENVQENVGLVGNVLSSMARAAVRNYTDLPKLIGQVPGLGAFEDLGVGVDEAVNKIAPLDVKYKDSFWASAIPSGLGQILGMVGGGLIGGAAKVAGGGIKGLIGSFAAAGKLAQNAATLGKSADIAADAAKAAQLFTEAAQLGTKAKFLKDFSTTATTILMGGREGYGAFVRSIEEEGDDVLTATAKSLGYSTVSAAIGAGQLARVYDRVGGMFGKEIAQDLAKNSNNEVVKRGFKEFLNRDVWKEMVAEFKEEAQQALAQDLIVGKGFSTDIGNVLKEGGAGAVVGGLVGAITGLPRLRAGTRPASGETPGAPVTPTTPGAPVTPTPPGEAPVGPVSNTPLTEEALKKAELEREAAEVTEDIEASRKAVNENAAKIDASTETNGNKPLEAEAPSTPKPPAPSGTEVDAPVEPSIEQQKPPQEPDYSGLSPLAQEILRSVDRSGSAPTTLSRRVRQAAAENDLQDFGRQTPNEVIARLRRVNDERLAAKAAQQEATPEIAAEVISPVAPTSEVLAPQTAAAVQQVTESLVPSPTVVQQVTETPASPIVSPKRTRNRKPVAQLPAPTPATEVTPAPVPTSPAPEVTQTPTPEGTQTPAPEGTQTPAPEGTQTPAPEGGTRALRLSDDTESKLNGLGKLLRIPDILSNNDASGISAANDKAFSADKEFLNIWRDIATSEGIKVPKKATFKSIVQSILDKRKTAAVTPAPAPTAAVTSAPAAAETAAPEVTPAPAAKQERKAQQEAAKAKRQRAAEEKAAEAAAKKVKREREKAEKAAAKEQRAKERAAVKEQKAQERAAIKAQKAQERAAAKALKDSSQTTVDEAPDEVEEVSEEEALFNLRKSLGKNDNSQPGVVLFSKLPKEEQARLIAKYTEQVIQDGIIPTNPELTAKLRVSQKQAAGIRESMREAYALKYPKAEVPEGYRVKSLRPRASVSTFIPHIGQDVTDENGKTTFVSKPYFDNTVETAARVLDIGGTLEVPAGIEVHPNIRVRNGRVVGVDYLGYNVSKQGDYSQILANDQSRIERSIARAEAILNENRERWYNDTIQNELLPRYQQLSAEAKTLIRERVKERDASSLKDRIAQVDAILRDRKKSLESPESEAFADEIKLDIEGYQALRDSLSKLTGDSVFKTDDWLLIVDPKIVRDVVVEDLPVASADKPILNEIARITDERFRLIEESLFPTVGSNINANPLLALTQKIRKESLKGSLSIRIGMGDVLNPNHWLVMQTTLRKLDGVTPVQQDDGTFKLEPARGTVDQKLDRWGAYFTAVDKANPDVSSFNKYAEKNPNDRVAQSFLRAAQVTKNDVIAESIVQKVQSFEALYPNLNKEEWVRVTMERLQNSIRSYKGRDPKSRTEPILYGITKAVLSAAQNMTQKTRQTILMKESEAEELNNVAVAYRNTASTRGVLAAALDNYVDDALKSVKLKQVVGAKNKKSIVQDETGETVFDILYANDPKQLLSQDFTEADLARLKQRALEIKRSQLGVLVQRPGALAILESANESEAVNTLKEIYAEGVNLPTDAQGRPLPIDRLSFQQLISISPKFSKTKVTNVLMRQVDKVVLEAKAKELGAYRLLRYGAPYAGVQAFYDPLGDTITLNLDNLDGTQTAIRKLYHELTERNMVYLQASEKGKTELKGILNAAKTELMTTVPETLKASGYASLQELQEDYGFTTEEETLGELMARYAERLADKPKPNWWQTLLAKVQLWLSKTFGTNISPRALEYWLAGNINRFADASPDATTTARTVAEKLARIDARYESADDSTREAMVNSMAQAAGLVGPLYHSGSFDAAAGDVLTKPMHLGTEQAAIERGVGKPVDDEIAAVEAYQDDNGIWQWDDTKGITSEEIGEEGFDTEQQALEAGRAYVFSVLNTDALDASEQKVNRMFIDAKKIKRVPDVGGANGEWDAEIAKAQQEGYDAISYVNQYEDRGSISYIVWSPNQVKSGDVATFDDAGKLIPLSKRFNLSASDPRFSRVNTESDEPLSPEELALQDAEILGEAQVIPRERFEKDTRKMIQPAGELRDPRTLWASTRAVKISTDNPDHHELYRKLNSLNMQQLERQGLTNVTVQLDDIDVPYSFDPATNVITFSSKVNVPYSEMSDAIMRAGIQAGMVNAVLNGLPSRYRSVRVADAVAKLNRALATSKETMPIDEFVMRVFTDTAFMDRMYMTHPPGNPSENAGRMVMDAMYTLLGVNSDGGLAEGVARIFGSSQEAKRFAEARRVRKERFGGTKITTSMKGLFGAEAEAILKGSTYFAETEKENVDNVNAWVNQFTEIDDALLALRSDSVEAKTLTPREKSIAYALIATKLAELSQLAKQNNEPYRAKDLMNLSVSVARDLELIESAAGSVLQVADTIKRMFNGTFVTSTVAQPISTTQGEVLGSDPTVVAVTGTRPTVAVEAAAGTVATPAVERLLTAAAGGKTDPDLSQLVFGFFNEVYDPTKVNDKMIADLTERLVKKTLSRLGGGVTKPVVESIRKNLMTQVNAQLNGLIKTEFKKPAPNVESILLSNLDLAERLFDNVKTELLASDTLTAEQKATLTNAKFTPFDYAKAKKVLTAQVNLSKAVRNTLSDQKATLGGVINALLDNSDLSEADAQKVAKILERVYNQEAAKEARKQLERLAKEKTPTDKVKLTDFDKLAELFNLGAYEEEALWNEIAKQNPKLKLPTYDKALVEELAKEADEIQKLPDGAIKDERRVKVLSKIAEIHSKNLKGTDKVWYYAGTVAPAIWKAGILSGLPTQLVNLVATQFNVGLQSISKAFGYFVTTGDPKYFNDIIDSYFSLSTLVDPQNSMRVMSDQALNVGQNRFALQSGKPLSALESITSGPFQWHKYVGRLMSSADAFNTQLAYEINQRFAMRYAEVKDPSLLKAGHGFNPNDATKAKIESQLDAEGLTGRFRNLRRVELTERYRQDLVNDGQYLTKALSTSLEWTMNSKPKGLLGLILDGIATSLRGPTRGLSDFLLPFMNTVVNLTNSALDFGPVGIARAFGYRASTYFDPKNKYKAESPEIGSPEFYTQLAQGITGTLGFLVLGALGALALEDEKKGKVPYFAIYGPGPNDPNKSNQWRETGWAPYTMRIGELSMPYRDYPGISLMLGSLGTVFDTLRFLKKPEEKGVAEISIMAGLGIASSIFDKNILAGVSSLFEVLKNPNERGLAGLKRMAGSYVSGFTNPRLLNQIGDQILRTDKNGDIVTQDTKTFQAWAMSMLPFGGLKDRPALNVLGEPVTKHRWDPVAQRFADVLEKPHPIIAPIVKAGLTIPSPSKSTEFTYEGKKYSMSKSDTVFRRFVELRGAQLQRVLTPAVVANLDRVAKATDTETAQKKLGDITEHCRTIAVRQIQMELASKKLSME